MIEDTIKLYEKYIEYGLNVDFSRAIDDSIYLRAYNCVLCTTIDKGEIMDKDAFSRAFCNVISKLLKLGRIKVDDGVILYRPLFNTHAVLYNEKHNNYPNKILYLLI